HGPAPNVALLVQLAQDGSAPLRAHAVWLLGVNSYKEGKNILIKALNDTDALVRRRACEALIRAGFEPPVEAAWPLLADSDRFVRAAARLVLQRIDPKKWVERIWKEDNDGVAWEAIIALCKINQAGPRAEQIFGRLQRARLPASEQVLLDYLRTFQMALIHTIRRPPSVKDLAERCHQLFPHRDWRVNREVAILLADLANEKLTDKPIHTELLHALLSCQDDRMQQIHYFYCLRLLHDGWTQDEKDRLLAWFDSTKTWTGGHSFTPFLENILRDLNPVFTAADRSRVVALGDHLPYAALGLIYLAPPDQRPSLPALADFYVRALKMPAWPKANELKQAIILSIGASAAPEAQAALRRIWDMDPSQRDAVAGTLARTPSPGNWPYLISALQSAPASVLGPIVDGLMKCSVKPKPDDPAPYRTLLLASTRLPARERWKAIELLRHWTNGRRFGADQGDWKPELSAWAKWFVQTFPKEPALPDVASDKPPESKYKYAELLAFLEKDPAAKKGNPARGRIVFEKAQCLKCHKYGRDGEGVGPDLTAVSKRFKRADILESIIYPSKVISDQYRSTFIVTRKGQQFNGLAAPQGDSVTLLQSDGSKVTLKKDEIEQQFASLISVMPERLLDPLTKEEIADLFAFLESEAKP
ncbi:MAG TPA: HEAT repeat domain-containing protein, partial [Gemmataceae bacterium]|nr:HEAT repeat domain-containing protein [Gemmataceae bacterium]